MIYIKGLHPHGTDFFRLETDLIEDCITWFEAKEWVQDLRPTLDYAQRARRNPFASQGDFHRVAEVVHELGHSFGAFQNLECQALKQKLVDMEHRGSGRVLLSKFYNGIDDRDWPFIESADYLRSLGALDDTDPSRPVVIIPNFLSSPSNCVAPSSFYSVCCMDECEGLLAHVERVVAEPSATAPRLAEVISSLESDTVEAPRNLSSVQLARLDEIAAFHGGRIPLHGRLFAQWMHHAYPRECRFPHVAGTTAPMNQEEFVEQVGHEFIAVSQEDMEKHAARVNLTFGAPEALPWTSVEELVAEHKQTASVATGFVSLQALAAFAALASFAVPLLRTCTHARANPSESKAEKCFV